MCHLSSQGIIHRDLAARNVLLDYGLRAKVSGNKHIYFFLFSEDFGLSKLTASDQGNNYTGVSDMLPLKW